MKPIWRILRSTNQLWRYYLAIGVLTISLSILNLLQPLFTGWAIDEVRRGAEARISYVVFLAIAIFVSDLGANLFSNISGYLGDQMAVKANKILSDRYYRHILSLSQRYFDRELSGKIINRLNRSIFQISNFMNMVSNNFLQFIFSTVFALLIVAHYSWQVALMLLSLYPIYVWMTVRTSNTWQEYQSQKNQHYDIASGRFAEAIGQVKVVKSYNQEKQELSFFARHLEKAISINRPQSRYWHQRDVRRRVLMSIIFFGVYLYIFVGAVHGRFTPGQAVALILYAMQIRIPIFTISFLVENSQRAIADSRDYFEIMNIKPDIIDQPSAQKLVINSGQVTFEKVSFGYDHNQAVLKELSFDIKPHTKVALVGESGEGKTTITNLLLRLYEPQSGRILIDGQDISQVSQHSLRSSVSVVFQEPALFSGTIRENISYSRQDASDQEVEAAAKAANADVFITAFAKGYDSQIGEHGLKLSGGQKQRLAIARALLKNAPLLIMDEATSSLDGKSEQLVQEALERLMEGRTTIIIAHRLSTIAHVDQIITLRNGQVDEIGSPASLSESKGIYAQLLELQERHTKATKKKLKAFEIKV
ncbi:MAG TPA: ABC transporter ATP-binding protein [Candidatus Dormibacteraeota bacterium]|nr:ABC transporter ATP-binding protein [Candidatus Dormibacteraeota bacterium]